jgi:hypothetical protein
MEPKFIGGKHKKQTQMEPVYDQTKDLHATLFQIVEDLKEKKNEELRKQLAVSWKELEWCDIKFAGNCLELRVNHLDGALREPQKHPQELQKKLKETYDVLDRFENAVRKEFKKRTKKALTWVTPKKAANYELVALNGVYRFYAIKIGEIKTTLPGQEAYGE